MKTETPIIVRSYECDSYSHVNNAVYLNYLEHARMDFMHKARIDYKGLVEEGYYLYVTHIDIFYKASAYLDDELVVETEPLTLKAVQGSFRQVVKKRDGTVCVEATVSWASVTKDGRPAKMPEKYRPPALHPECTTSATSFILEKQPD